jgi:hypothetical protein
MGREPGSIYLELIVVCLSWIPCGDVAGVLNGPVVPCSRKGRALVGSDHSSRRSCRDSQGVFVMKKFSKKGVLLFVGAMAVCAFVMPALSSAASWGVVGTEHTLHSPNIGFTSIIPMLGPVESSCSDSTFTIDVRNANALTVTSARFGGTCTATGMGIGTCTVTTTATNNPDWTATGPTTSNIQIHNLSVDVTFEQHPGSVACINVVGARINITGTLTGGQWDATRHEVIFTDDDGLTSHGPTGDSAVGVRGTLRDTQQTLTLT